jgi:putative membrane protein
LEFDLLPALSSSLNAVSTILLVAGWLRIRRRDVAGHRRLMTSALVTSIAFLAVYLVHHSIHGDHKCGATGAMRVLYLAILFTHIPLAVAIAVLAPRVAWLGWKGELARHRVLARITLPMWLYVSVTGVAIYVMAYHLWPVPEPV